MKITDETRARLTWRCRRGMLELDLILENMLKELDALAAQDLLRFEELLELPDPELYAYLSGNSSNYPPELGRIIKIVKLYHKNSSVT